MHAMRNLRSTWPLARSAAARRAPAFIRAESTTTTPPPPPTTGVPLTEPLPDLPKAVYVQRTDSVAAVETRITTLSNGLRVASEPRFGQFCTVGVCVDSGSRYEVAFPSGVSHFLEKLAFGATDKFNSKDDIMSRLEKYGGICDCQSTRDTFLYAASVDSRGLEATVEILGDVVLRPKITDDELEYTRSAVQFELEDAGLKPDQEPIMVEALHAAAFAGNTLGLPKLCPVENVGSVSKQVLLKYLSTYHAPERMVLAGVGVDHDALVEAAQRHFVDAQPTWRSEATAGSKAGSTAVVADKSLAQYTGGIVTIKKDLSNASLGPTPMPELAHLTIGLEAVSHQHPDFVAFCVLNMLMGGGGSFSAGGPGKGMYTRLYTRVLNRHHWMYSATAFNHAYGDAGVFCITASGPPGQLDHLAQIVVSELTALAAGTIGEEELSRAKKQLQSMLLMNLESRPVIFEDVARQVLAQGHRKRPEAYMRMIEAVTAEDLHRIAERMLSSKPTVAAIGTLDRLPAYKDIELALIDRSNNATAFTGKKKFSLFR